MKTIFLLLGVALFKVAQASDQDAQCQQYKNEIKSCRDNAEYIADLHSCISQYQPLLQAACVTNNPRKAEADRAKTRLLNSIKAKHTVADKIEKEALADVAVDLQRANQKLAELKEELQAHGSVVAAFAKDVRDHYAPTFDGFSDALTQFATEAKAIESSPTLSALITRVKLLTFNEKKVAHEKQAKATELRIKSRRIADYFLREVSQYLSTIHRESLALDIKYNADIMDDIDHYLAQRINMVTEKVEQLVINLDQKLVSLMNHELEVTLNESIQAGVILKRKTEYFNAVNVLIDAYRNIPHSRFYNITYFGLQFKHTRALLDVIAFCESSTVESWQSLGCHRALQFKHSAEGIMNNSIPANMRFSLGAFDTLGDDSPQPEIQTHIRELIAENRIETASQLFDSLLTMAEEITQ